MSLIDAQRRLLTIDEVTERLGLSRRTVERKIEQGVIPAFQLGGMGTAIRVDERGRDSLDHCPSLRADLELNRASRSAASRVGNNGTPRG
jgi:excisionase family DNA binding protein